MSKLKKSLLNLANALALQSANSSPGTLALFENPYKKNSNTYNKPVPRKKFPFIKKLK